MSDPKRAIWDQNYHKSKRIHWGVTAPNCKKLISLYAKSLSSEEILVLSEKLWATQTFDAMIFATRLLSLSKVKYSPALWNLIETFLKDVDGWALEDTLAPAAWKCLLENENLLKTLNLWTKHPNFWMRRAALIFTLPFAKNNIQPERMLFWASKYANDTEWFIQKAIGWWLRVLSAKRPDLVHQFLNKHKSQLKSVAIREATRKLK